MNDLATLPELSPEATEAFNHLTPKQQRFVIEFQRTGNASEAYRRSYNAANLSEKVITIESCRMRQHPSIALVLGNAVDSARAMLMESAVDTVIGLTKTAALLHEPDTASASKLATAERAAGRLLQGAGLIGQGSQIQVNVGIDNRAIELWQQGGAQTWRDAGRTKANDE